MAMIDDKMTTVVLSPRLADNVAYSVVHTCVTVYSEHGSWPKVFNECESYYFVKLSYWSSNLSFHQRSSYYYWSDRLKIVTFTQQHVSSR